MHALTINFIGRRRIASPLGLLLFAAGVAMAGAVAIDYLDARAEAQLAEAQLARLQRQSRPVAALRRDEGAATSARDDAQALGRMVSQLRLPWDALLREIEMLTDPTVALLSIEGQGQARTLRLTGEAQTMADAVAYVSRLRESPWIDAAHLSGHEERQVGAVRVIRFSLDAVWSGPS